MLDDSTTSRAIGSNETAIMMNADEHELDTDPGIGQGTNDSNSSSMHRNLSAAVQAVVEEPTFNLRLIEAVKQSHCLYDASDRQYRSADYKIKVWNRLVHVLGFQGDARTLYNRWKQLRDKYGKEKKKMKYSGEHQSTWQYFKHLEFLDPHMVDRTQQRFERNKDGKEQRQIVITDPNFALHLVNEVRLQPCLYDIKDPKYRHTEYRNQAWSEIAKNLTFPGDVNALYKQWKKIRDRYVREKRKLRMTNGGEQEEPGWDLYRELMWIDPYLDERAAQVKRKRECSDLSGDEALFMEDAFSSTLNSSGMNSIPGTADLNSSQSSQQHHQQQGQQQQQHHHYMMQRQPHSVEAGQTLISSGHHQLQQLIKLEQQQGITRVRPAAGGAGTIIGGGSGIGLSAASSANATLMMPIQPQQHVPLTTSQLHHQLGPHHGATQHVIITNEPATIDGDRAFAISVAADLLCLPEQARAMARAQIQHLLENSKITIVKA